MSITSGSRRGFLRSAYILTGGALISIRMTGTAVAKIKELKDYMLDRINGVYGADVKFLVRASQDNTQVKELYADFLKKPLGERSEHLLHTRWRDKSAGYSELAAQGVFPNPRDVSMFAKNPYPYEQ